MMANLKDLGFAFRDAQTGQLGYLLTGEPADLAVYEAVLKRLAVLGDRLRQLDTDSRSQQQDIGALELLVQQTLDERVHAIELRSGVGADLARPVTMGVGGRLTGQIETMLASRRCTRDSCGA